MRAIFTTILLCGQLLCAWAQDTSVQGIVTESDQKTPVFAANVYCKSDVTQGTTTGFDGEFTLEISDCDTVCISYLGFKVNCLPLSAFGSEVLRISLQPLDNMLREVVVKAGDPISEKFSVVKMDKMDVYLDPVAAGDPLKALTSLPSSTNADETANPVLRGSGGDRSRVVVNGAPIRNPVRNGQLNGLGNFSLFNAEIIRQQYVYASNPPLTYGNTSAGLIEIETNRELENNQVQVSTSLASVGTFVSQKLKDDNFFQLYGNFQFADAFLALNDANLPRLKDFGTKDVGLNLKLSTGKQSYFNSFSYFIDEYSNFQSNIFTVEEVSDASKKRFFTINNWNWKREKSFFRVSTLVDWSTQDFTFGNIISNTDNLQLYSGIDYKIFLNDDASVQFGASYNNWDYEFNDLVPEFFYAVNSDAPSLPRDTALNQHNLEAYAYGNWDVNDQISLSTGLRSNTPIFDEVGYLSAQLSVKYEPADDHRFLLSGGRYSNYSTPNYSNTVFNLLNSTQLALDYNYEGKKTQILGAFFVKSESGRNAQSIEDVVVFNEINTMGIEFFIRQRLTDFVAVSLANTYLHQTINSGGEVFQSPNDFNYFAKVSINYNNPAIINAALSYIGRPGRYYNPIIGADFDPALNAYIPTFTSDLYNEQFNAYNNLSFSSSRYIPMGGMSMVAFLNITNLLNTKNQASDIYNSDYSQRMFNYLQLRTVYFGVVFQ
ncbi:MAG: carboxypeptidase-like regulatory domain-containing protein, partial [Bacteroidota bacterium]